MNELFYLAIFMFAWIALNRWVLPALGIPTCMSGGCSGGACRVPVPAEKGGEESRDSKQSKSTETV